MKKQVLISIGILVLFTACEKTLSDKKNSNPPISQEQTSQETQKTTQEQETEELTSQDIIYINKGTEEEAILSKDPSVYENNYYKYKDIMITFRPEQPDQGIDKNNLYDIVLIQNGKETAIKKSGTSFYGGIFPLEATKRPHIVEYSSGFGDAGVFSVTYNFINILNGKILSIHASNTGPSAISSFDENGPGLSPYFYDILEVEKNVLSLINEDLIEQCLAVEDKKIELPHLLLNNKPIIELPEPASMDCYEEQYGIFSDESFTLIGPDENFEKIIFSLKYNNRDMLGISEKLKHGTGYSSLTEEVKVAYELDLKNKAVRKIQDNLWERKSVAVEMD